MPDDADVIAHFDNVPSLLYLVYVEQKMNYEDGKQYVKEKLESYKPLDMKNEDYLQRVIIGQNNPTFRPANLLR